MPGLFSACSFRTLGAAATTQNLFSLENTDGSAVNVKVRRLVFQMDAPAVLTDAEIASLSANPWQLFAPAACSSPSTTR